MADSTSSDVAAQEGSSNPLQLSSSGQDFVQSLGSNAAQGAADTANEIVPSLASSAGSSFASGALDQLTQTVGPYLPFAAIGLMLVLLLGRR
jgi:hypothetical protein